MPKPSGCGANSNGSKTPNQCFKTGIYIGQQINKKKTKKANVLTRPKLMAMGKGQLEALASKKYKIKRARHKTKGELATEIMAKVAAGAQ